MNYDVRLEANSKLACHDFIEKSIVEKVKYDAFCVPSYIIQSSNLRHKYVKYAAKDG